MAEPSPTWQGPHATGPKETHATMQISDLAHVNVTLNGLMAVLLTAGYTAIRFRRIKLHRGLMVAALVAGAAFLTSYLIYHFNIGSKKYTGGYPGVYYPLLISHIVLAAANLPMVIVTATRAFRERFDKHRRIARVTLPIWWYVSVTGVIVYFMLY
jgi:uncharacterized membrane protein YozB (DUF420 family)